MTPEEQLLDLQHRFRLLENERNTMYQTAQLQQKQNKQITDQLNKENAQLREEIKQIRQEKPESVTAQVEGTMSEIQLLQRRVDGLRSENASKKRQLDELDDKHRELTMDSKLHSSEASPQMRQIRVLENRLDKAMIKYNEAQSIRKTYEAIVKRLTEERRGFDNQLASVERTLKAKERDYEELLLLSHDAYHAKEMAQAELHRFEQGVQDERTQRDREVQEKKLLVEQRVAMNKRLEKRERELKAQEENAQANEQMLASADFNTTNTIEQITEEKEMLRLYDEAFDRLKEATGVMDVNEIIQIYRTQDKTTRNLQELTDENQSKIDKLTSEMKQWKDKVDELKFSSGGTAGRRQAIDASEARLNKAAEAFERNKAKFERVAKMVIDLKGGISHLGEKLASIKTEGTPVEMTDETVEDYLTQCDIKIQRLLKESEQKDDTDRQRVLEDEDYERKLMQRSQSDARIKLSEHDHEADDDDDDDFDDDVDEDVPNYKHIKYVSKTLVDQRETKKRKGKKNKRES